MVNLKGVNVYLIGMMGCGKSTTGKALAQQLGYGFVDTDDLITQLTDQAITDIFAESGEAYFRQIESKVLSEVAAHTKLVVATGGGIVLEQKNWSYLQHGLIVWLDVEIEQLWQRLQADTPRPLLQKPNPKAILEELLTQRRPLYRQADVHLLLKRDQSVASVCQSILQEVTKMLRVDSPDPKQMD